MTAKEKKAAGVRAGEASALLAALGLPTEQQNERSALTLLALAAVGPRDGWGDAAAAPGRVVDLMAFMRSRYGKDYAPNTRETIRRRTLHQFVQAGVAVRNLDDPARPTNSGKTCYGLTAPALAAVRAFGTAGFAAARDAFLADAGSLRDANRKRRAASGVPLTLPGGRAVLLSPGEHNRLEAAVVERMGPRFVPGGRVLYVGDAAAKDAVCESDALAAVGVPLNLHDKLPDVVLHHEAAGWLVLVEAVTSHGPVDATRHRDLEAMLSGCPLARVYVTAFPDRATFRQYAADLAWETEAWIADEPGHMVHFNGPKFLGPYPAAGPPAAD